MEIEITYKRHSLIMFYSPEDEELINKYCWRLSDGFYAEATVNIDGKNKSIKCHRLIMNVFDPNIIVDHKNGDELDNRRENLRLATIQENGRNKAKIRRGGKFRFKGVGQDGKYFNANISVNGKRLQRGHFETEEEAAKLYDAMAAHFYGEFARYNFPEIEPFDYLEWQTKIDKRLDEIRKNSLQRKQTIQEILSIHNCINVKIIQSYLSELNIELTSSNRTSFFHELRKMVESKELIVEKLEFDKNQTMNHYIRP